MKKIFLFFAAALLCQVAGAQHTVYCELVGVQKFAKSQVTVAIDFGQEKAMRMNALGGVASRNKLVDENGKPLEFNSMVDAMNYMGSIGWEFEQAYVVTIPSMGGGQNVYHWLLSKPIDDGDEIDNGIKTKSQFNAETSERNEPDAED